MTSPSFGLNSWRTLFWPEFHPGGLHEVALNTSTRLFDDFESYASSVALQAVWVETGGAGNPTLTTVANAIRGNQSMEVTVAGAVGTIYRDVNNNFFHFAAGRRIRYITFRGIVTTGTQTIRVRLSDASDATLFREWEATLSTDRTRDAFVIDLYSGGAGYWNSESYPGPISSGATAWNPALIDRFEFRNLADGSTFRFDDIRFWYEYSLLDVLGLGTEPPTDDGADGSIHSKLRYLNNLVLQKIGETQQYSKYAAAVLYLNNSYTFGLELKSGLFIPNTTEITPGNYLINRVRNGTTTTIVASTPAAEDAGFISVTYTPLEDNWQPGDQLIVLFSGGWVDKDTDTAELLTANAAAASTLITVANAALFQAGQRVRIYDDTPDTEIQVIVSIDSPTTLTVGALANTYTTAANARIVLVERTLLETARLASNITYEPQISQHEERWVLADYDDFDFADADGNNERWDIGYIANSDGSAAGAEGGSANINTTTPGQARVAVEPDATPTHAAYALKRDETLHSHFFTLAADADVTLDGGQASSSFAGLRISAGDVDDPANYVLVARERSSTVNRITAHAEFMGVVQTTVNFNTSDNAVAFKIERYGNVYNIFYSLTQWPNWVWVKLTQFEDATGDMTSVVSAYLYAESGGSDITQTALVDFDNWKYYISSGALDQILSLLVSASGTFTTSSTTVPADTGRLEGNDYWNSMLLMPVTGVAAYQSRPIVDFANAGGVFTIDAQNPFSVAPAIGDEYVILPFSYPLVPSADAISNQTAAHVIGNKSDAASVAAGTASVIARLRAIEAALSVNAAGGGEFELDGVADLWDALVNDSSTQAEIISLTGDRDGAVIERLAALINSLQITDAGTATGFEEDGTGGRLWETLTAVKGTFTTSNATVPADTGRTEANDYFNGDLLIPLTGAVVRQARVIADFANAGGVFTLDPQLPFTAVPGLVDYIIIHFGYPLVPAADATSNLTSAHVIGNKSDAAGVTAGTASIIARLRAIEAALSVNAAAGGEFELDGDPDLWDALVNNSSADASITTLTGNRDAAIIQRLAAIINAHGITDAGATTGFEEDGTGGTLWASLVAAKGTFTTSSTTVPADTGRSEVDDYFNGDLLIPLSGAVVGQARAIADFANAGGVFTLDSELPFTTLPGLVTYIIIHSKYPLVPAANSAANTTSAHVVGNKSDIASVAATASQVALLRAQNLALGIVAAGAGGGFEIDGAPSLVTALGTTGAVVTDSATSVLGAIGANNANNAFDSSTVIANENGSVLERLEDVQLTLDRAEYSLADYDDFDVADADGNTERWNPGYLNGAEGGSADINTTTAGQLRVAVDPDATPTAAGYGVNLAQPIVNKYFSTIVDLDVSSFGTPNVSWATLGMRVSPVTFDTNNQVYIQRQESSGAPNNRITAGALFNAVQQGELSFTTADTTVAFKIERLDNVWRCYYSLSQYPDFVWVLLAQYEDPSEFMDAQQSVYLDAYSPGNADAQTALGDFDNWKLYEGLKGVSQEVAGDYDSSVVAADEDGSLAERLEQIQEAVNRGTGTSIAANRSLVDALGSDGTTVTDSAVSVLGAIGANNANNAFDSSTVAENGDGSVLERLEELRGRTYTTGSPFILTNGMGTAEQTVIVGDYTPIRMGRIAALLDLNTLVAAGEGGNIIVRLKFMIDGATLRTIDRADFLIGTDEVHPTVSGFVVEGASFVRVTIQASVAVSVDRNIPYRIIEVA